MTRHGKIARLPRAVRDELNRRLANGEAGVGLVEWLNALTEVRSMLAAQFDGREITEQNLSVWKQGGFADWERHEEAREWVGRLAEESDDLEAEAGAVRLAERVAVTATLELGWLLEKNRGEDDPAKQRKAVLEVAKQLVQLRRGNHEADRVRMESERWEMKKEQFREEQRESADAAARWKRLRTLYFPDLDDDGLPAGKGQLTTDLQACLAANSRLRKAANPVNPSKSK